MSLGQDIQTDGEPVVEYDDGGDGSDPPYPPEIPDEPGFDLGLRSMLSYLGELERIEIELLQSVVHWEITQLTVLERIDSRLEEQNREHLALEVSSQYAVGLLAFLCGVLTALVFLLGLKLR